MIRKIGKKGWEWIRERARLIKEAVLAGRIQIIRGQVQGKCEDCKEWKVLDPDHRRKRSLGGEHNKKNIDWVCRTCHNKRDNQGDPMGKKESSKKPNWIKLHKCKSCKTIGRQYLCASCGSPSV